MAAGGSGGKQTHRGDRHDCGGGGHSFGSWLALRSLIRSEAYGNASQGRAVV